MVRAFAGVCLRLDHYSEATALLAGFDTMLRSAKLYRLKKKDVTFYDIRAVLSLGYTKTGKRANATDMVVVESSLSVCTLRKACSLKASDHILWRSERFFRTLFNALVDMFDLEGLITVYSLRRGGASCDFLQFQSLGRTLLRGRWASTSSARVYHRTQLRWLQIYS